MNSIVAFLKGKKTYILSAIVIAYAVLAYFKVLPEPNVIAAAFVVIAGYAVTFHAVLVRFLNEVTKQ